ESLSCCVGQPIAPFLKPFSRNTFSYRFKQCTRKNNRQPAECRRQSNLLSNTSKKESSYNGAFPEVHAILREHLA
ncbi:MAG: hypothetical protein WBA43_17720, partial [Elainellaceae cyanobacterium]